MKDLEEEIIQLIHTILVHLKAISHVLSQDPDIARRLSSNPHPYGHIMSLLEKYQE
jgi:hypothetical protein